MGAAVYDEAADGFSSGAPRPGNAVLARQLFQPAERWGWVHQQPVVPAEGFTEPEPAWTALDTSNIERFKGWRRSARQGAVRRTGVGLALIGGGWLAPSVAPHVGVWSPIAVAAGAVLSVGPFLGPSVLIWAARVRNLLLRYRFGQEHKRWESRRRQHEFWQQQRHAQRPTWEPITPGQTTRVDVIGGTGHGWASLVTTMGASLVAEGTSITVVDLSEERVGGGLAMFAAGLGYPVQQVDLPDSLGQFDLLDNLTPAGVAELIAHAVYTLPTAGTRTDHRALHRDLIRAVVDELGEKVTWSRLVAGLMVLRRVHTLVSAELPLSKEEIRAITAKIDLVGSSERVSEQVQYLTAVLSPLAERDTSASAASSGSTIGEVRMWPPRGVTVVATGGTHESTREMLDALLVRRLVIDLSVHERAGAPSVLILAGADHLGLATIEAVAKQAQRVGVRVVLLLAHLRDDLRKLLGTGDGATVLMRLGNAHDAKEAAEFIGRHHTFVLSQITDTVGKSFSDSQSTSQGSSDSTGRSEGTSTAKTRAAFQAMASGYSSSTQDSVTTSRAQTWQDTVSTTSSESTSTGTTRSRVYEFQVEPTKIQSLPHTAFILVEHGRDGRRVVAGDCNPGIGLLPQVLFNPEQD